MKHLTSTLWFALALSVTACGTAGRGGGPGNGKCPTGCTNCQMSTGMCLDCTPGQNTCSGAAEVHMCNANGTVGALVKTCDTSTGQVCGGGNCASACDAAAGSHSYIGCDYWPVSLNNTELPSTDFDFAVAVANPIAVGDVTQGMPAQITVTRGGQTVATDSVNPGDVKVIILPWVQELAQIGMQPPQSGLVPHGAYHLTSSLPVTVYQFSPLEFEKPASSTCMDLFGTDPNTCHSYTNDASLLLPTTALDTEYVAVARGTFGVDQGGGPSNLPGLMAVVGVTDGTQVTVQYPGMMGLSDSLTDPGSGVSAQPPGSTATYTLNAGDVLQVLTNQNPTAGPAQTDSDGVLTYYDYGKNYDLTGAHITASNPVAVFGGHVCAYVPYNRQACDHLEEQMFPLNSWGQNIAVTQTEPQATGEPNVWRIVSGSASNHITFDPTTVHAPVDLGMGQWVEFVAEGAFFVKGTGRIAVGQYMVGENYTDPQGMGPGVGDPSLGLGTPVEQFRNSYDFLVPATYTKSYIDIIAPPGINLMLDMQPYSANLTSIGASGFGYSRQPIQPGAHHLTADQNFGISISGIAAYTSYLYVGGQNIMNVPVQ